MLLDGDNEDSKGAGPGAAATASATTQIRHHVCLTCKTRKKKCDRKKPECTQCRLRGFDCQYVVVEPDTKPQKPVKIAPAIGTSSNESRHWRINEGRAGRFTFPSIASADEIEGISERAHCLIRATDQYMDDISSRYFQSIHRWLPLISRRHFQEKLINNGCQAADFSILLLSFCLVTYRATEEDQRHVLKFLYLGMKTLLAQLQVFERPSIYVIQASVLCAVFEYAQGRADTALVTIGACARIACAAGIHMNKKCDDENLATLQEQRNLWWAIIIMERIISCDATVSNLPLTTELPSVEEELPLEADQLDHGDFDETTPKPFSSLTNSETIKFGGFIQEAQASCLLDRVLRLIRAGNTVDQYTDLVKLDVELRALLSSMMISSMRGVFCGAIAITLRALIIIHKHSLSQLNSVEPWSVANVESSHDALGTITKIAIDVAHSHTKSMNGTTIEALPPACMYVFRAALQHLKTLHYDDHDAWIRDREAVRMTLKFFDYRWGVEKRSWDG